MLNYQMLPLALECTKIIRCGPWPKRLCAPAVDNAESAESSVVLDSYLLKGSP